MTTWRMSSRWSTPDSAFIAAIESLNVKKIMSCWSESENITMLFPGAEASGEPAAVRQAYETMVRNTSRIRVMLRPLAVMRMGDLGWIFSGGSLVSTHGDETLTVEVYITNIYRREEDGWKLIHHHSAPGPHQPSYLEQRLN